VKRADLKRILRPIVKEMVEDAIEDILLQEGFVNQKLQEMILEGNLIQNVVRQVSTGLIVSEASQPQQAAPQSSPSWQQLPTSQGRSKMAEMLDLERQKRLELASQPVPVPAVVGKLKTGEFGKMFEGTTPLGDHYVPPGSPDPHDHMSKLNEIATVPDPELGGPVSEEALSSLLGGMRFNIKE